MGVRRNTENGGSSERLHGLGLSRAFCVSVASNRTSDLRVSFRLEE